MCVKSQQNIKNIFRLPKYLFLISIIGLIGLFPLKNFAQDKTFTVVLDPGHGGKDPGTIGTKRYNNLYEKDIVLSVALKVGAILEKELPDVNVIYTRKTDVFVELHKRGEIANKADADLFVSIHINSASPSAKGTETYVLGVHRNESNLAVAKKENDVILLESNYEKHYSYDPNDPSSLIGLTLMQEDFLDQSIKMAKIVENSFVNVGNRKSKGVKQAGFVVLHQSYMPSILTEIGFLSNVEEEDFLRSEAGQDAIAHSIVDGIKKYKSDLQSNGVYDSDSAVEEISEQIKTDDSSEINEISHVDLEQVSENKKIKSTNSNSNTIKNRNFEGVIFKVQIASSINSMDTKAQNFKGLTGIERVKTGDHYKYYLGNTSNYDEILALKEKASKKGYSDCFIVAFKGKERVSVESVLKSK
jgi:N-acetylmuramoyl-L-alanine amidase